MNRIHAQSLRDSHGLAWVQVRRSTLPLSPETRSTPLVSAPFIGCQNYEHNNLGDTYCHHVTQVPQSFLWHAWQWSFTTSNVNDE